MACTGIVVHWHPAGLRKLKLNSSQAVGFLYQACNAAIHIANATRGFESVRYRTKLWTPSEISDAADEEWAWAAGRGPGGWGSTRPRSPTHSTKLPPNIVFQSHAAHHSAACRRASSHAASNLRSTGTRRVAENLRVPFSGAKWPAPSTVARVQTELYERACVRACACARVRVRACESHCGIYLCAPYM